MTRSLRRAAWLLAFLAVALQAVWPLLAEAKPRSGIFVPVCSLGADRHYSEVPLGQTPAEKRTAQHGEHCGFCMVGTAISPALPELPILSGAAFSVPFSKPSFFAAVPAVLPGRPRAPPVVS